MPAVSVHWKPNGLPIATATSPTRSAEELPSSACGSAAPRAPPSRRITARSVSGSSPTSTAPRRSPSGSEAVRRRLPATTWLLVSAKPSGVNTTPEPFPRPAVMCATAGPTRSKARATRAE